MEYQRVNTIKAAKFLGLRPGTLEVWRSKGRGPRFRRIGRKIYYDLIDLEAFANAQTVETVDSMALKRWEANH